MNTTTPTTPTTSNTISQTGTRYPQSNLAACMLPWTEGFNLDVPVFERHVREAVDGGYKCIYLMGTAGEGYAPGDALFKKIVEVFAGITVRDGIDPQIGVIGLSMQMIIDRLATAYDRGIRMFQISLPSWGPLDLPEMLVFFSTVCGAFPDCRFLHYNLPRAKKIITGAEYRQIADTVPNLVATKNSTTDYARTLDLMRYTPDLQHFFLEGNFAMGCTLGECSLLCSYDTIFPKLTWKFFEAGIRKDLPELFRITEFLQVAGDHLLNHCERSMIDGAYDKILVWLRDPEFSYRILPPYIGMSEDDARICREIFDKHYRDIE